VKLGRFSQRNFVALILVYIGVAFVFAALFARSLYLTSLDDQAAWLERLVKSQAKMIAAVAAFDAQYSPADRPDGAIGTTTAQLLNAYREFSGFGESGEFVIGQRRGDLIVFLDVAPPRQRETPRPLPIYGDKAEPLQYALIGQSGTLIGRDYRGIEVLAAYEPLPQLGIGIVAKIDLAEIRAPFITLALLNTAAALAILSVGGWLTYRLSAPLFSKLERRVRDLQQHNSDLQRQLLKLEILSKTNAGAIKRLSHDIDIKNRFFLIIAHDLRSPFNALLGMTEVMAQQTGKLSANKLSEYAGDVHNSARRVFQLLENLLAWSRLQMGEVQMKPSLVSLKKTARTSIDILTPVAREKNITLRNLVKDETLFANPSIVETVLRNLISNAIKFSPPGGKIEISAQESGATTEVMVSDKGVGMDAEATEKGFALGQVTTTMGTAGETGTGLGLPLCQDLLEKNQGRIWVETAPGKGSRFHFELPRNDHANHKG
tara:strand:+ start:10089 stop:11555 length:1467 start_codon:yes stop_codon:yes gene_type:complete